MMKVPLICRLAFADLRHARVATLCQIFGLAALLVPLLIILGIKNGYIEDRTQALLENPEDLRIQFVGQDSFSAEFVQELRQHPDVRYIGAHPIQLAVQSDFAVPVNGGPLVRNVTLLATGAGDPYLGDGVEPPARGELVLSAALDGQLGGLEVGDLVEVLMRPNNSEPDGAYLTFTVSGILPAGVWGRTGALLETGDLFLLQDWTHGDVDGTDLNPSRESYPDPEKFPLVRLYATDVDGAFRLVEDLARSGYASGASLEKAADLLSLRNALNSGFNTVAIVGLLGVAITFTASLWAAISRNRRPISLLRVGGLSQTQAFLLPATQAALIGTVGWVLSVCLYALLTGLLNIALASTFRVDEALARLSMTEFLASAGATLVVSLIASLGAAYAITSITPEEGFLDVR
ncbi:MAG: FtsX-like permease family protein [Albidovulum sp.]|uniref:ABC transporter permease n=1 Tax=Albidovulum sp. TaxID=1872424 RepID=UPI003CB4DC16